MAKQIVAWCDIHMARDENVPGHPVRIALNGALAREVDLCEPCEKEIIEPVRMLIEEAGQPVLGDLPKVTKEGAKPYAHCPECGNPAKSRDSFNKHLRQAHGKSVKDEDIVRALEVQHQASPPLSSSPAPSDEVKSKPFECPDCDDTFETPQGRGAHRNKAHGYRKGDDD